MLPRPKPLLDTSNLLAGRVHYHITPYLLWHGARFERSHSNKRPCRLLRQNRDTCMEVLYPIDNLSAIIRRLDVAVDFHRYKKPQQWSHLNGCQIISGLSVRYPHFSPKIYMNKDGPSCAITKDKKVMYLSRNNKNILAITFEFISTLKCYLHKFPSYVTVCVLSINLFSAYG